VKWVVLLVALAVGNAAAGTLDDVKKRGELRWGGDIQGGEPYVYEDPAQPGRLIGFEVDIAEGLAKRLGVKSTFVQVAWSSLVPSLERGDFDMAMNGLESTPARQEKLLLSKPYYIYAETLAVRRGSALRYLELLGKRVGTLNQTYAFDLIRAQGIEPVLYEGAQEPYLDLAGGRLDAVLLDNVIADRYGCPLPEVTCLPSEAALGAYVIGFRRGDADLQAAIDAALDDMVKTGELRGILERAKLWNKMQEGPPPTVANAARPKKRAFDGQQLLLFIKGAGVTLWLSAVSFALAVLLGMLLAVARVFGSRPVAIAAAVYVEIFRGTPVLLQLYVLYFALAPVLRLNAFEAAVIGLGLNYAAYEAEIYRGAILSLPRGQTEAAHSLGMSGWQTLRHILLPQALRVALPAMTNDFVALLKDSSVVSVITVVELTKRMTIAGVDLNDWVVPGLACAALYFAMSFPLAHVARILERNLSRDSHPRAA
jgi:polar amino acid transport system permease protein/polar amino acid transport system substrate-binding protein